MKKLVKEARDLGIEFETDEGSPKDKLYKAIIQGKFHTCTMRNVKKFRKAAEVAGENLEKALKERGD